MARPVHNPHDLATWQDGETRQIYARYRANPDAPLWMLPDRPSDEDIPADEREWIKTKLECFMPDCADRRLFAVHRAGKRDGLSHHHGAGKHTETSLNHEQGCYMIAEWARRQCPEATVTRECTTGTRDELGRHDVLITWPNGARVGFEIQYSPLTIPDWRRRTEVYQQHGTQVVWLWGHTKPHCNMPRQQPGLVKLTELHRALIGEGVPLLWINPTAQKIGTVHVPGRPSPYSQFRGRDRRWGDGHDDLVLEAPPESHHEAATLAVDALEDCRLTPDGFSTPRLRALHRNRDKLVAIRRARAAKDEHDRQSYLAAGDPDTQKRRWDTDPLRQQLMTRFGSVPDVLAHRLPHDSGVRAWPGHWHAVLYQLLIAEPGPGYRFTLADCYRVLRRAGIWLDTDNHALRNAVLGYLEHLVTHQLVAIHRAPNSTYIEHITVRATLDARPSGAAAAARPDPRPGAADTRPGPQVTTESSTEPTSTAAPASHRPGPPHRTPRPEAWAPPAHQPSRRQRWWTRVRRLFV